MKIGVPRNFIENEAKCRRFPSVKWFRVNENETIDSADRLLMAK